MKHRKTISGVAAGIFLPALTVVVLLCFFGAVSNLTNGHADEDMQQLEEALRRAAVACYAAEGIYPPDLAYMQERYGIQINEKRYAVDYIFIADNLMPDITVLEKW